MASPIITLTTDFGLRDAYVAEMKAVILSICPNASIIDVSHKIEKFNVRMGAFVLASAFSYFPKKAIHVAVIDPRVGTERQPVVVETRKGRFVGPNNGVLSLAVGNAGGALHVHLIANKNLMLPKVSNTFQGRDIFAPTAAHLASGRLAREFGPEIGQIAVPEFATVIEKAGTLLGEVIHVDDFGNIVTNFSEKELVSFDVGSIVKFKLDATVNGLKFCKTYADVERSKPLALIGSHDFLEISVNQGNAARFFGVSVGDNVTIFKR